MPANGTAPRGFTATEVHPYTEDVEGTHAPSRLPSTAVVVATRNRAIDFASMLDSLDVALSLDADTRVYIVDNGSNDSTPEIVQRWCQQRPSAQWLRVSQPGKSRALNTLLPYVDAEVALFTDDDVIVDPHWIRATKLFFANHREVAAMAGRILPLKETDKASQQWEHALKVLHLVLPIYDRGENAGEVRDFYGANCAIRLSALRAVGGFDTRLGPGALGMYDDLELASRLSRSGYRIWYNPAAVVYHRIPANRMTRRYFFDRALMIGRSAHVAGMGRSLAHDCTAIAEASLKWLVGTITLNARQRIQAEYRIGRHLGALQARLTRRNVL